MIAVIYGDRFLRSAQKLSKKQQTKLAKFLIILQRNPFDTRLHTKHYPVPWRDFFLLGLLAIGELFFNFFPQKR